jgi:hypothetical protein
MRSTETKKKYEIYLKDACIYEDLSENEFHETWKMIHNFIDASGAVNKEDVSYKEV